MSVMIYENQTQICQLNGKQIMRKHKIKYGLGIVCTCQHLASQKHAIRETKGANVYEQI